MQFWCPRHLGGLVFPLCATSLFSGSRGRSLRGRCVGKNGILGRASGRGCAKRTSVSEGKGSAVVAVEAPSCTYM
jgi:hypothetical protein